MNSTCICDPRYSGYDCASPVCPNNCSLHGICTANSTCGCDIGYHGVDCSLSILPCGAGAEANCSGHGICVLEDSATQWWSGSEYWPDMWFNDPGSGHLSRQDTGLCISDYFGRPLGLSADPLESVKNALTGRRRIRSQGVPDHFVASADKRALCQVNWVFDLPLNPTPSNTPVMLPDFGVIAVAVNGIPIFGPKLWDGSNAVEGNDPVPCYGHSSQSGMWHYHHPSCGCDAFADNSTLIGYALDGFPIYGPLSGDKESVDVILDKCNGRFFPDGTYAYHVRNLFQVNESLPYKLRNENVQNEWRYVLGCFSGNPVVSLGVPSMNSLGIDSNDQTLARRLGLQDRTGRCFCDIGWGGSFCSSKLCKSNCSGHGNCQYTSTDHNASCLCDPLWGGEDCSIWAINVSECFCSGHGSCIKQNSSNSSFSCLCDLQWSGSDCGSDLMRQECTQNCSEHGSCKNGTCVCDPGFSGNFCEHDQVTILSLNTSMCWQWIDSVLVNNSCSGHGFCSNGSCLCDPDWTGLNCSARAFEDSKQIDCVNNCSLHGTCIFTRNGSSFMGTANGTCLCDVGWGGFDCSVGDWLLLCPDNCTGHGSCRNNNCTCDIGWSGSSCSLLSSYEAECANNCSGHGTCSLGVCWCDSGWIDGNAGNCSVDSKCASNCSGHGTCNSGNCSCDPGWTDLDCSLEFCQSDISKNCSGHGTCSSGNCTCDSGWLGKDCSIPSCPRFCSNNGLCQNGSCTCSFGYFGADCAEGPYDGECPRSCGNHGACVVRALSFIQATMMQHRGFIGSVGCMCDAGWTGPACDEKSCPNECSMNGACFQNGSCYCYKNWAGFDCSLPWCPNDCSNHGSCVGGLGCSCDVGYQGLDCSLPSCPNNCSMNGICLPAPGMQLGTNNGENGYSYTWNISSARCLCLFGWAGDDCAEISCPSNCSYPNGLCMNGTCLCNQASGYFGTNCSEQYGAYALMTDGSALTPSYGIFLGGTTVTVRGTGFVNSGLLACKFGGLISPASLVQPEPPSLPYALCLTPSEAGPITVYFTFSLNGVVFSDPDPRIVFVFHAPGVITAVNWPTGPARGDSAIRFSGSNFQYATAVLCKFGESTTTVGTATSFFSINGTQQLLQAQIQCNTPALVNLGLPDSAAQTVDLFMSMDAGRSWLQYDLYPYFKYYGATHLSPSFGPDQDQNTIIRVFGFNLYQGLQIISLVPGFSYSFTCRFMLPWTTSPFIVPSNIDTWVLVNSPNVGSYFSCTVPPGLTEGGGYNGPVGVGISLNPCLTGPLQSGSCIGSLDYDDSLSFYFSSPKISNLSVSLGPVRGNTYVTLRGVYFNRRDTEPLPVSEQYPILCQWGECTTSTGNGVLWENCLQNPSCCSQGTFVEADSSVICPSSPCLISGCSLISLESCPSCYFSLALEIALNGQDFSNSGLMFAYFKDPRVSGAFPTLGPVSGGTLITVFAEGFVDPCINCTLNGNCATCKQLTVCRFSRNTPSSMIYTTYSTGVCPELPDGTCDSSRIICIAPDGNNFRDVNSILTVFEVTVSVSVNNQQFFPADAQGNPYDSTSVPSCSGTEGTTSNCALFFMYYLSPLVTDVYPRAAPGNGGGRVTVTGSNFINLNPLTCVFGDVFGNPACSAGATCLDASECTTGDQPCVSTIDASGKTVPCCQGASSTSAIFVSSSQIICPTLNLRRSDGSTPSTTRIGLSFNGQNGSSDISFLVNISDVTQSIIEDALVLYWTSSIQPSLGPVSGSTIVSARVLNLPLSIFQQLDVDRSGFISPSEFGPNYAGGKSVSWREFQAQGLAYEFDSLMKCKFGSFIVDIIADISLAKRQLYCSRYVSSPLLSITMPNQNFLQIPNSILSRS